MPVGHSVGHFQHPPPELGLQIESVRYVDIASYYHYVHKLLSGIGQFHESVNLGVKILKWPDSHFYILIS